MAQPGPINNARASIPSNLHMDPVMVSVVRTERFTRLAVAEWLTYVPIHTVYAELIILPCSLPMLFPKDLKPGSRSLNFWYRYFTGIPVHIMTPNIMRPLASHMLVWEDSH
jgi:hypothetical protein